MYDIDSVLVEAGSIPTIPLTLLVVCSPTLNCLLLTHGCSMDCLGMMYYPASNDTKSQMGGMTSIHRREGPCIKLVREAIYRVQSLATVIRASSGH